MLDLTERQYSTDAEAYEVFVGGITPQEFVKGFDAFECPVDEAVKDFLRNWPYGEPIPEWLESTLCRYVESRLDAE
jgi:hypothetical protein